MALDVRQIGIGHESGHHLLEQAMHQKSGAMAGAVVYAERLLEFNPEVHPFLNTSLGVAMNQDLAFGTVTVVIHDGGDTVQGDIGTADGDTTNELVDSGGGFNASAVVGSLIVNTNGADTYANATAITTDTRITMAVDLFPNGNEGYTIDPVWVGTAVAGTWNFADSAKITLTGGVNNDEANFDVVASEVYDFSNFTALSGKIDLDTYDAAANDILVSFELAGVLVGNTVSLNGVINAFEFAEQGWVIPKSSFGISTQTVDRLVFLLSRTGGPKPSFKLDDLELRQGATPTVFKATTPKGTRFHITEIRIGLADNISGITTVAGNTETATVPNLAYDDFMGITTPLTNGIVFQRVKDGKVAFSATFNQLGDFLSAGSNLINHISDGTNTFITLLVEFPEPIILDGSSSDFLSFTIQDDLSGLLQFTAAARGALEI